jgi:hypothetical protein
MLGVHDATRDLQVFGDDRFYQFVFGIYPAWFFGLILGITPERISANA